MDKYLVLGCGPAGLMAVQGIIDGYGGYNMAQHLGVRIVVLSNRRPSELFGAQYLHAPIPHATDTAPVTVEYLLRGSTDGYRQKVYGDKWDGLVSPEDLSIPHKAWDIRSTYSNLWLKWHNLIMDAEVGPATLHSVMKSSDFTMVFNSIPLSALCPKDHTFRFTEIIAAGDAPSRGIQVTKHFPIKVPENSVICNGDENPTWYRASNIFGHVTVEWPIEVGRVPITSASTVRKPLDHNCDCWPGVIPVGRYGTWQKGVLSHQAYEVARDKVRKHVSERIEAGRS